MRARRLAAEPLCRESSGAVSPLPFERYQADSLYLAIGRHCGSGIQGDFDLGYHLGYGKRSNISSLEGRIQGIQGIQDKIEKDGRASLTHVRAAAGPE